MILDFFENAVKTDDEVCAVRKKTKSNETYQSCEQSDAYPPQRGVSLTYLIVATFVVADRVIV